jgi:hypothetical protein
MSDTNENLISPTRELIREGRIIKISARGGERLERFLILVRLICLMVNIVFIFIIMTCVFPSLHFKNILIHVLRYFMIDVS